MTKRCTRPDARTGPRSATFSSARSGIVVAPTGARSMVRLACFFALWIWASVAAIPTFVKCLSSWRPRLRSIVTARQATALPFECTSRSWNRKRGGPSLAHYVTGIFERRCVIARDAGVRNRASETSIGPRGHRSLWIECGANFFSLADSVTYKRADVTMTSFDAF